MEDNFEHGGSRLQYDPSYQTRIVDTGKVGNESSGHPLANDKNGSCYWADKDNVEPIWQYHDSKIADHELGFPEDWSTENNYYRKIDCDNLSAHEPRKASGYEKGANGEFTGNVANRAKDEYDHIIVDPERNNGMTSGGQPECVTNPVPLYDCRVSEPKKFDNPNKLSDSLCDKANSISSLPESENKKNKLNTWNSEANALKDRISGEQDYLHSRIKDHENRMSEFPEGSLEYNRAKDNRDWCITYNNNLTASKDKLQSKQDELSSLSSKNETTQFNPSDYIPNHTANGNSINTGMGMI